MTREHSRLKLYQSQLEDLHLFQGVSPEAIKELLDIATPRTWERKSCVLDTTHTLSTFYIILDGRLKAYQYRADLNRQLTLFLLTAGDIFDVCAMIKGQPHDIYYEALDETELLCIPIHLLKDWMRRHQAFYLNLLEYTIAKMSRLEHYLTEIIMEDTCKRLAILLYNHMNPATLEVEVLNGLSHAELAALIGTTRTMVGRHLNHFQDEGILETNRKEIRILELERLQEFIS